MCTKPEQYVDVDEERAGQNGAESEKEMSEHERYESLCREPLALLANFLSRGYGSSRLLQITL